MVTPRVNGFISPLTASEVVAQMVERGDLSEKHLAVLHARAISNGMILARGYRTVKGSVGALELEKGWSSSQKDPKRFPALAYPVYQVGNALPHTYVLRPDNPRTTPGKNKAKTIKYEWPRGVPLILDVLPKFKNLLGDPKVNLWISPEGSLKADALASAGASCVAAYNGVYGWRSKNDMGGKLILPDFEEIALEGRHIILPYDSDMVRNGDVMAASRRFGGWLTGKGARVSVLSLPQVGDEKMGVDDFLATLSPEQRTVETLMQYVIPLIEGTRSFTDRFGKTEEGRELLNPPGFQNRQGPLTYTNPQNGTTKIIYGGYVAVTARGRDADTKESTLTVSWCDGETAKGAKVESVTAPQAKLATTRGVIEILAGRGASVHESNAKNLAEFLVEFARINRHALDTRVTTSRYGYREDGIVGPGWSVGTSMTYNGHAPIVTKRNGAAEYRAALAEAGQWGAMPLMLALGLSVISPHLERLQAARNPVMWLSGNSNWGKTSIIDFAVGLYGDTRSLTVQAGRSTWAGFLQRLQHLRGFPVAVDEAQTMDPARLQNVIYQHANGQNYARGGRDGQPQGSDPLSGTVYVAGEAPPQLTYAGARNRVLDIRASQHMPLGIAPDAAPQAGVMPGAARSDLLKNAVEVGAGALGERITQAIWEDWDTFEAAVNAEIARMADKTSVGREWLLPIAAATVGLDKLYATLDLPVPNLPQPLTQWALGVLLDGRSNNDPVREAFDAVRALVLNAPNDLQDNAYRAVRGERVAVAVGAEWYILQNSDAVKRVLEPFGGLQGLAVQWAQRGWIVVESDGTTLRRRLNGARLRYLVVTNAKMIDANENDADGG